MFRPIKNEASAYKSFKIPYTLFKRTGDSKGLAVMLPGKGYTTQAPLFHYSTGLYLNKGYDVLHIDYNYNHPEYEVMERDEFSIHISRDVNTVINKVLTEQSPYPNLIVIGKSLGTIALSTLVNRPEFTNAKLIWLTPLLQLDYVFERIMASSQQGFCVIGSRDPFYIKDRFENIENKKNLKTMLLRGADHSLNLPESPVDSIDLLKKVMVSISEFH